MEIYRRARCDARSWKQTAALDFEKLSRDRLRTEDQRTQELSHFVDADSVFRNLQVHGTIRDLDLQE